MTVQPLRAADTERALARSLRARGYRARRGERAVERIHGLIRFSDAEPRLHHIRRASALRRHGRLTMIKPETVREVVAVSGESGQVRDQGPTLPGLPANPTLNSPQKLTSTSNSMMKTKLPSSRKWSTPTVRLKWAKDAGAQ